MFQICWEMAARGITADSDLFAIRKDEAGHGPESQKYLNGMNGLQESV
jgi:hypothetical protein